MKTATLSFIVLIVASCGDFVDQLPVYKIQCDLETNVNKFYKEASLRNKHLRKDNLIVSTSSQTTLLLPSDAAGYFIEIGGQKYITLWDDAYYYFIRNNQPEAAERLLFHEMGHAFGREHNNNPESIMCQCMPSEYYKGNDLLRSKAIDELMGGITQ